MGESSGIRKLSTTEHTFRIIEILQEHDGARISEITGPVDLSKGTVYQHLVTLRERGYVTKEGDEYYLGLRFANLGEYARNRKPEYVAARDLTRELAEKTNLEASFAVEENGRGVYLRPSGGEVAGSRFHPQVGERMYLHSTAAGKAMLAEFPSSKVEEICEQWGLPAQTDNTITSFADLEDELERVRKQGHAFNHGENESGVRAVAVPIVRSQGTVLGAATVEGPEYRLRGEWFESELPAQVKDAVESSDYQW